VFNIAFLCGEVASEPELRFGEDQADNVSFNLDISLPDQSFAWLKVYCLHQDAELAARQIHRGTRVVVIGPLVRGSLKVGKEIWWNEVMVVANVLEVIE